MGGDTLKALLVLAAATAVVALVWKRVG